MAGAFKIALTFLDNADSTPAQAIEKSAAPAAITPPPAAPAPGTKAEVPATNPLLISPTAVERHSFVAPVNAAPLPTPEPPAATRAADVTGSVMLQATSSAPAPAKYGYRRVDRVCARNGKMARVNR